ncbi:hypothetical protein F441_01852, partial [Phytophthora nicotianae CJ01A1]
GNHTGNNNGTVKLGYDHLPRNIKHFIEASTVPVER